MSTEVQKPTDGRLGELVELVTDEHMELGPLDRDDLRVALSELINRRIADTGHSAKVAA